MADGAETGVGPVPVCMATGRCSVCITLRLLTTVEMACLKINCSWLLFSRRTEYLSKDRIFPVSLTPLTRYIVIGVLSLRTVLRNVSWMFCAGLLSMCRSPIPAMSNCVLENAQALAATAKLGSEPDTRSNLLLEVYTPYRVALEPNKAERVKSISAAIWPTATFA